MRYTCNRILPGESRYGGSKVNLKSMSLVKLTKLKDQVDAILHTKVTDQRRSLGPRRAYDDPMFTMKGGSVTGGDHNHQP
jgi:hypothetical protein